MVNEKKDLGQRLAEAAEHRTKLDTELCPRFRDLKAIFGKMFVREHGVSVSSNGKHRDSGNGGSAGSVLKLISDMLYYRGGYPNPSSPPRTDVLARQTAEVVRYLSVSGHLDELRGKLREYGVDVKCSDKDLFRVRQHSDFRSDPEFQELLKRTGVRIPEGASSKELMTVLLAECLTLQGQICSTSNKVKKEIYSHVSVTDPHLRKPDFLGLVKVKATANRALKEPKVRDRLNKQVEKKKVSIRASFSGLKVASGMKE